MQSWSKENSWLLFSFSLENLYKGHESEEENAEHSKVDGQQAGNVLVLAART